MSRRTSTRPDTKFCDLKPGTEDCVCPTFEVLDPNAQLGFQGFGSMRTEDVNSVYRMYAQELVKPADGAHYGHALAVGDFDRDGYGDLAVGPDANAGPPYFESGAGTVLLYRGTSIGPATL